MALKLRFVRIFIAMPPSRIQANITTHDGHSVELLLCNLSSLICLRPRPGSPFATAMAPKNQKGNSIRFPNALVQRSFRSINLPECQILLLQTNQLLKTEKGFSIKCDTYNSQSICLYAQTLLLATRREKRRPRMLQMISQNPQKLWKEICFGQSGIEIGRDGGMIWRLSYHTKVVDMWPRAG